MATSHKHKRYMKLSSNREMLELNESPLSLIQYEFVMSLASIPIPRQGSTLDGALVHHGI